MTCPTPCDPDCKTLCHEWHVPGYKREHDAEDCERVTLERPHYPRLAFAAYCLRRWTIDLVVDLGTWLRNKR